MKKRTLLISFVAIFTLAVACSMLFACGGESGGGTDGGATLEVVTGENGIVVSGGGFAKGSVLVAEQIATDSEEGKAALNAIKEEEYNPFKPVYVYDISVVKDNAKVQPNGKVRVSIPVTSDLATYRTVLHIKSDGTVERLSATYADGKLSFETYGFSIFVLVEPVITNIHEHVFSREWSQSETQHWHACLGEKCEAIEDLAEHYYGGSWDVRKEATATETGLVVRVCIGCKYEERYTIPTYDPDHVHTYETAWSKNETHHWHAATCSHTTEVSGKAEHTWDDGEVTTPATDEADGVKTYTCTACGKTKEETFKYVPHEHTFADEWSKDDEYHWYAATCSHITEVSGKAEHTWDDGEVTTPATDEADGVKTYTCTACGKIKVVTTPHQHVYKDWYFSPTDHWQVTNCSYSVCGGIRGPQSAHEFKDGACKDCGIKDPSVASTGLEFTLQEDGAYFVSGIGTCTDIHLVIPSVHEGKSVTGIASQAFKSNKNLRSVYLPDSVKTIGDMAFQSCSKLNSVRFPDNMLSIGEVAFSYADLHTLTLPTKGLTEIKKSAFQYNQNIINLYIPDNVKTIGEMAFYECAGVTELRLPETMTALGVQCFAGLNMTSVTIPNGITELPKGVFASCDGLTSVTVPSDIVTIGDEAFSQCDNLETVILPAGLTSLGKLAFAYDEKLKSITIPSKVTELKEQVFNDCSELAEVNLPSTLTAIGTWAFANCTKLASITLPSDLITIDSYAFSNTGLKSITVPGKVKTIGGNAFQKCKSLESVTFSDGLTTIGRYSFTECTALTAITIPDSVTEILDSAFSNCTELETISLPASLTKISSSIINGTKIKSVTIPAGVTEIGANAFSNNKALETVTFGSQSKLEIIRKYAFQNCENLTTITIPSSIKNVEKMAFNGCLKIGYNEYDNACYLGNAENPYLVLIQVKDKTATSCTINTSTVIIAGSAFDDSAVTSIHIPDSVKAICDEAFTKSKIETATLASIDDWCYVDSEINKTYIKYSDSTAASEWNGSSATDATRGYRIKCLGYMFREGFLPSYTNAK